MSWIERIKNEIIIVTGDGKEYRPSYMNPQRETQFHVAPFEYINKRGTHVHRGKDKGKIYPLEIYFQGEDNIDVAKAFDKSTQDSRPWEISHPLYDAITVQPVRIHQDNTQLNVTKFTCTVIETTTDRSPSSTVSPKDQLENDLAETTEVIATEFENENFTTADTALLTDKTQDVYDEGQKGLPAISADEYHNKFQVANAAIANVTSKPLNAMRKMQAVIAAPHLFASSVQNRIDTLENTFNKLRTSLTTLVTRKDKTAHEAFLTGTMVGMLSTVITGESVSTISEVTTLAARIGFNYDQMMIDLDSLQSANAGSVNAYVPNGPIIERITRNTNFALSFLKEMALGIAIEHSVVLEEDSNVIILTHRFYGLKDPNDEKLQELIDINNIGLNEMLRIRKGRTIKYLI